MIFNLRSFVAALVAIPCISASFAQLDVDADKKPLKIVLIGDSTVRDYPEDSPRRGWGQLLAPYFDPSVILINEASNSRSSKTFPSDTWGRILDIKPDFVLIQFGYEDADAKDQPEATDFATDYKDNLKHFIEDARFVGATPILVTPPPPREFKDGQLVKTNLADYAKAMTEVGVETKTAVIDLNQKTADLYSSLGEPGSSAMTVNKAGWDSTKDDRVHYTAEGARQLAHIVARELPAADAKLASAVKKQP